MQIYEITALNEGALGAFASGFAQGAGINVPDISGSGGAVSAYGPGRYQAALAAAKPLIASMAKQEMQSWNSGVADLLKQKQLQDLKHLPPADRASLETDLRNRIHKVFMQGQVGNDYTQLASNVEERSQPAAKDLVDKLNLAVQSIMNFDNPPPTAAAQLQQWQNLSLAAYEAMALAQFYPKKTRQAMPKVLSNPDGSYNLGSVKLTQDPVDIVIIQKIQAEQESSGRVPALKLNADGSINIGSGQRLDPRDPNEAKAIERILSASEQPASGGSASSPAPAAPQQPAQNKTVAPASFNAQNVMKLPGMTTKTTGSAAMGNMANQLAKRTAPAESKRR